jgi:MoaA/NifB/PqqE/SkfB family radical SAM enzyme
MCIAHHHLVTKNKQQLDIRLLEKLEPYFEPCVVGRLVGAGEPFTNKQFMEYARMFSTKLCRLACTTNGTLINGKTARSLIETQFDYLIISLDAARKETFEQIRKGASFNRVIHNIRRLVRLKKKNGSFFPIISYSMVVMNQNIQELVPLVELVHDLGGCHLNVVPMTIPFKSLPASYVRFYRENALCLSDNVESTRKVFELADRKAKELNVNLTCNVDAIFSRPAPEQIEINTSSNVPSQLTVSNLNVDAEKLNVASDIKPEPGYCVWPWAQFYLRKDGKVALCCNAAIFLYGDLHEQSIEEISNSRGIMAVRRAILEGRFPTVACKLCYIRSQNASLDYLGSNLLQIMRKFNYIG